jgi:hypothetical protein
LIGLLDIDSKMPNIALMKLKAYYGSKAKMISPIEAWGCDKVYASSLFNFSTKPSLPEHTIYGGTGYNIKTKLPQEVQSCQPDYSIYPRSEVALQRYSTGCIRSCPFCVVQDKEGQVSPVEPMNIPDNAKWIYLLDNNFFASPNWLESIKHLMAYNKPIAFEGVDIRIITEDQIAWLAKVKFRSKRKQCIAIAWDNPEDSLEQKIRLLTNTISPDKIKCYVLIGYWSTPEQDLHRVETLKALKVSPFVMPYNKYDPYQRKFARWVNRPHIFNTTKWSEYK